MNSPLAMKAYKFRKATLQDVKDMQTLINRQAARNKMLPRSLHDLYEYLRDFFVCTEGEKVVGVCALHITWEDLGEVRSLAVAERHRRNGIGRALVKKCLSEARKLGLRRVFSLTYCPGFFAGLGFSSVDKAELPHKVWAECIRCHQFPDCDEEAMLRTL